MSDNIDNNEVSNPLKDIELGGVKSNKEIEVESEQNDENKKEEGNGNGNNENENGENNDLPKRRKEYGKNKTLSAQLVDFATGKLPGRARRMQEALEDEEKQEKLKSAIMMFKLSTDPSFLEGCTPDELWLAILRREAWRQHPYSLLAITVAQISLCLISMLSSNDKVNSYTLGMAIIYALALSTSNPYNVTSDLKRILTRHFNEIEQKHNRTTAIIIFVVCALPLLIAFSVTLLFDFFVGRVKDSSYGALINTVIDVLVISCGLSVGLRSGSPIDAIQTFAGFEFIMNMDEAFINTIQVDLNAPTSRHHREGKKRKILITRITLYVLVPIIFILVGYITFTNICVAQCGDADDE